ncbi:MAG: hypothetical protein IT563_21115 [Alphaproteobacteria bacterium]|nr:hypothetical protein [Alphaproteobacteria bacterium]
MLSTIRIAAAQASLWAGLWALAAVATASPLRAQETPREGMLYAASYVAIPPGSPVTIHLLDDNDGNRDLAETFRRELTARGFKVVERAPFTLTFWLTGTFDTGEQQARRSLVEIGGEGGSSARTDNDVEARVNLFSTRGGGLFQDPPVRGDKARTGSRYRLYASVKEEGSGRRAWLGQAHLDVRGGDPLAIADAMVPILSGSFGQTVRRQPFTLP